MTEESKRFRFFCEKYKMRGVIKVLHFFGIHNFVYDWDHKPVAIRTCKWCGLKQIEIEDDGLSGISSSHDWETIKESIN